MRERRGVPDPLLLRLVVAAVRFQDALDVEGGFSALLADRPVDSVARADENLIEAVHQYVKALPPVDRARLARRRLR